MRVKNALKEKDEERDLRINNKLGI